MMTGLATGEGGQDKQVERDEIVQGDQDSLEKGPEKDQDSNAEEDFVEGGYGWVIVISCFIQNIIADGMMLSFGVLYVEFMKHFNTNSSGATWVISIQMVIYCGIGPIVSALSIKLGTRLVVILGSILIAIGTVSSAYVPSISYLYLTFSCINVSVLSNIWRDTSSWCPRTSQYAYIGVGLGVLYQTAACLCSSYFKEKRGRVNGIVASGSGVGLIVFPLLITFLLDNIGFIRTFFVLAGVALLGVICGALIISPAKALEIKRRRLRANDHKHDGAQELSNPAEQMTNDELEQKSLLESETTDEETEENKDGKIKAIFARLIAAVKLSIDVELLRNPSFVMYSISSCLYFLSFVTPLVFLTDRAISFGITAVQSASLISMLGGANMAGRLIFGFINDRPIFRKHTDNRLYLFAFSFVVCGLITTFNFGEEYLHQIIYAVTYGACLGCQVSMRCTILADMIGHEKLSTGFGMMSVLDAIGVFLGPASAGWLFDATHDYRSVFAYSGIVFLLNALIILFIPLSKFLRTRKTQ